MTGRYPLPAPRCVVVFARAPELGTVKTRLASELGAERALEIYRDIGRRVISSVATLPECEIVVAYTPDCGAAAIRSWLGTGPTLRPQRGGDLGRRMSESIAEALGNGAERVVVIGTDCPQVSSETVEAAFSRLDNADVVLGPASDGGYYLIGMTRPQPALFEGIPWSSDQTLGATLSRAKQLGLRVALLEEMRDVDTAEDWRMWMEQGGGRG